MSADGPAHALPPGYRLYEYRIERVLGHGGFGITYLAYDENLAAPVAIKEYLPDDFALRDARSTVQPKTPGGREDFQWGLARFLEEAQTLARFRHPNIVQVSRLFRANGTAYIVMPYERGRSLADYLDALGRTLSEVELLNLAAPLLDGLEAVHAEGFLHRDIKPGNVFIRSTAVPILLDFGSARTQAGSKGRNMTAILTPGYAPIEQYGGAGSQGPWTDIYGFAGVLYRCIAGRAPLGAPERSQALLEGKPDPLRATSAVGAGAFSPETLAAIDHGLRVPATDRPQSVSEWRGRLLAAHRRAGRRPTSAAKASGKAPAVAPPGAPPGATEPLPPAPPAKPPSKPPPSGRRGRGTSPPPPSRPARSGPSRPLAAGRPGRGGRRGLYAALGLGLLLIAGAGTWFALRDDGRPTGPWLAAGNPPGGGSTEPADTEPADPSSEARAPDPAGPPGGPRVADARVRLTTSAPAGVGPVALTVPLPRDWSGLRQRLTVAALPGAGTLHWREEALAAGDSLPGSALDDLSYTAPADAVGGSQRLELGRGGATRATLTIRVTADRCDRLAADPDDAAAPPPGVPGNAIDAARAVDACRRAVERYPDIPRFRYQLARALARVGDRQTAMAALREAANRGHEAAAARLAALQTDQTEMPTPSAGPANEPGIGPGTPLSRLRALAEAGEPAAQRELARRYGEGDGLGRDPRHAAAWYRRAAEQGDGAARLALGQLHAAGTGVVQDPVRAAGHFAIAAGDGSDGDIRTAAIRALNALPAASVTEAAQRLLTRLGYRPGRRDGTVDFRTRSAVRRFQEQAGLAADGRIDAELLAALAREAE